MKFEKTQMHSIPTGLTLEKDYVYLISSVQGFSLNQMHILTYTIIWMKLQQPVKYHRQCDSVGGLQTFTLDRYIDNYIKFLGPSNSQVKGVG